MNFDPSKIWCQGRYYGFHRDAPVYAACSRAMVCPFYHENKSDGERRDPLRMWVQWQRKREFMNCKLSEQFNTW